MQLSHVFGKDETSPLLAFQHCLQVSLVPCSITISCSTASELSSKHFVWD